MHKIYHGFWELIGNTPLVRVERYQKENGLNAEILVKLEALNPAGSVKDRVALGMIEEAEAQGRLAPGALIIADQRKYRHRAGSSCSLERIPRGFYHARYHEPGKAETFKGLRRAGGPDAWRSGDGWRYCKGRRALPAKSGKLFAGAV